MSSKNYHDWVQKIQIIRQQRANNPLSELEEAMLDIEMIDAYVEHLGDRLPDAEYIIKRVQKRLDNDLKY